VVSGIAGAGLGLWLWQRGEDQPPPRALLWAFNLLGLGLLTTIVTIAVLSMPTPFRAFDGPPTVFVATVPFVWLPTVMVMAALLGHCCCFTDSGADRSRAIVSHLDSLRGRTGAGP
jgi:hypothetical protein